MFSSGTGKKPVQAQQEMVQVGRPDSESPFWQSSQRDNSSLHKNDHDSNIVVGASYSHADLLKINSQAFGSTSRPQTPPSRPPVRRTIDVSPPPLRPPSPRAPPPLETYFKFLSTTNGDWMVDDDGYEAGEEVFSQGMDDSEEEDDDEFGLPGLAAPRRRLRQPSSMKTRTKSEGPTNDNTAGSAAAARPTRRFSNSADIAVERPVALYPMPKKTEGKILRPQYKDILQDPANALHLIHHPSIPASTAQKEADAINSRITRINKFKKLLQTSSVNLPELKQLAWSGIPEEVRAVTWQLLLSYLPTNSERRASTLERKRKEYLEAVKHLEAAKLASERGADGSAPPGSAAGRGGRGLDEAVWHQIKIDVPRTNPHIELYGYETTKRSLERILYVWAVRHPASGYVQGINDLVTPFWEVFLGSYMADPDVESGMDPGQLPKPVLDAVEADSFWCLTKLLEGILDHYIVGQPGIQRQVRRLRDLTARVHAPLVKHLEQENVEFLQFSFRWMNCLLMREISVRNTIRMWDTYLAEEQGFSEFHLYVCAAFLVKWSSKLLKMDFQDIMMFLQSLPTKDWTEKDIELLLSEAFIWQSLFKGSSAHLRGPSSDKTPSDHMQL